MVEKEKIRIEKENYYIVVIIILIYFLRGERLIVREASLRLPVALA
jgi:hypothetical protein